MANQESHKGVVSESVRIARNRFPCGLIQPGQSYRFGLEALLLAGAGLEVLKKYKGLVPIRLAELGCGCGASLIACALERSDLLGLGLDIDYELIRCGRSNATSLGLDTLSFMQADFFHKPATTLPPGWLRHTALVMANPPWRVPGSGRLPQAARRKRALAAVPGLMERFLYWAKEMLMHGGLFCAVVPPAILTLLLATSEKLRLGLRKIQPVTSFKDQPASLLLLVFHKDRPSLPIVEPPLVVHERQPDQPVWSQEVRSFCPWLKPSENP